MGVSERKEREREQKRSMILEVAERLILEKGLDQLNMDELAEQAEVSKGSLYLYFKNKTDLVLGICHKASCALNDETSRVLTENKTGFEMVKTLGENFLNFAKKSPHHYSAMRFLDSFKDTEQVQNSEYLELCTKNKEESFRVMVRVIQVGMQDGSIKNSYNAEELALLLWATSQGVVNLAYIHENMGQMKFLDELGISVERMLSGYMDLIGTGIRSVKVVTDS